MSREDSGKHGKTPSTRRLVIPPSANNGLQDSGSGSPSPKQRRRKEAPSGGTSNSKSPELDYAMEDERPSDIKMFLLEGLVTNATTMEKDQIFQQDGFLVYKIHKGPGLLLCQYFVQ